MGKWVAASPALRRWLGWLGWLALPWTGPLVSEHPLPLFDPEDEELPASWQPKMAWGSWDMARIFFENDSSGIFGVAGAKFFGRKYH
jgi:hypothetical protein